MLLLCFALGIFGIFFKTFLPLKWGNGSGFLRLEGVICVTETGRYVSRVHFGYHENVQLYMKLFQVKMKCNCFQPTILQKFRKKW